MKIHDLFFWIAAFFLAGALLASFTISFIFAAAGVSAAAFAFSALSFIYEKKNLFAFSFLIFAVMAGFSYYHFYFAAKSGYEITFNERAVFEGVAVSDPDRGGDYQKFILNLNGGNSGRVVHGADLRRRQRDGARRPGCMPERADPHDVGGSIVLAAVLAGLVPAGLRS